MSAPLCNTCGEALSTLSHPPSGQERDCPERETEMAKTRETHSVAKALSVAVELLDAEEGRWWRRWDAKDEDDYCQGKAEEYAALAQVLRENRSTLLAALSTPREPEVVAWLTDCPTHAGGTPLDLSDPQEVGNQAYWAGMEAAVAAMQEYDGARGYAKDVREKLDFAVKRFLSAGYAVVPLENVRCTSDTTPPPTDEDGREGEVREALEEAIGEVPPEGWEPRDTFGDYQGYGDLVDDVDLSNNGDVHSHGFAEGWWSLAWKIRRALRGPTTSPATEAREALRGLSRRVRDHIVACHRTTATGADPDEIVGQIQETKAELDRYHDEVVVPLLGEKGGG